LTHNDPGGAERMTNQLASLMRSSLDSGSSPLVPLDEEVRLVRDYLDIERVRFGDRLGFTIEMDELAKDTQVPRLSLQTIVENSVKYAISQRREGGCLAIRAALVASDVTRLSVEDDGPGFDGEHVPEGHRLRVVEVAPRHDFRSAGHPHHREQAGPNVRHNRAAAVRLRPRSG
jgi:two-component system sensor histidine kinase AlgZ